MEKIVIAIAFLGLAACVETAAQSESQAVASEEPRPCGQLVGLFGSGDEVVGLFDDGVDGYMGPVTEDQIACLVANGMAET